MMDRFLNDRRGSAIVWTVFAILILCTLTFVVYAGVTVYAKYQMCETDLERVAVITVDKSMVNSNVRDVALDIPAVQAETLLEDNLTQAGWTLENGNWVKRDDDKLIYSLESMSVEIDGRMMHISAVFVMPLPWNIGSMREISIPMKMQTSVLYIDDGKETP